MRDRDEEAQSRSSTRVRDDACHTRLDFLGTSNNHSHDDISLQLSAPTFIHSFKFPTFVTKIDQTPKTIKKRRKHVGIPRIGHSGIWYYTVSRILHVVSVILLL